MHRPSLSVVCRAISSGSPPGLARAPESVSTVTSAPSIGGLELRSTTWRSSVRLFGSFCGGAAACGALGFKGATGGPDPNPPRAARTASGTEAEGQDCRDDQLGQVSGGPERGFGQGEHCRRNAHRREGPDLRQRPWRP